MRVYILVIFYLIFACVYCLSPYWTMLQIGHAIQKKDHAEIILHINKHAIEQQLISLQQTISVAQDKARVVAKRHYPNINGKQLNQVLNGQVSLNTSNGDAPVSGKKLLPTLSDEQLNKIATAQQNNKWLEKVNLNFNVLPLGLTLPLTSDKLVTALIAKQEGAGREGFSLGGLFLRSQYIDNHHLNIKLFSTMGVDVGLVLERAGWFDWKISRISLL